MWGVQAADNWSVVIKHHPHPRPGYLSPAHSNDNRSINSSAEVYTQCKLNARNADCVFTFRQFVIRWMWGLQQSSEFNSINDFIWFYVTIYFVVKWMKYFIYWNLNWIVTFFITLLLYHWWWWGIVSMQSYFEFDICLNNAFGKDLLAADEMQQWFEMSFLMPMDHQRSSRSE